jgi:Domain of unknown function (DUF4188)
LTAERWARSLPHKEWWQSFPRDRGGTGFWHETYFRAGGMESVYIDMAPMGFAKFGADGTGSWLTVLGPSAPTPARKRRTPAGHRRGRAVRILKAARTYSLSAP